MAVRRSAFKIWARPCCWARSEAPMDCGGKTISRSSWVYSPDRRRIHGRRLCSGSRVDLKFVVQRHFGKTLTSSCARSGGPSTRKVPAMHLSTMPPTPLILIRARRSSRSSSSYGVRKTNMQCRRMRTTSPRCRQRTPGRHPAPTGAECQGQRPRSLPPHL